MTPADPIEFSRRLANGDTQECGNHVVLEDANGTALGAPVTETTFAAAIGTAEDSPAPTNADETTTARTALALLKAVKNLLRGVLTGTTFSTVIGAATDDAAPAGSDETTTARTALALLKAIKNLLRSLVTGVTLANGTANIGIVAGAKLEATATVARPANTDPYLANDVFGTSLAISGATNATPIVITSATHGLSDGDPVTISAVGGNTNANGNFWAKVTGYSTTTFALYSDKALTTPVAGNSNYTTGGVVARCFRLQNVARVAGGAGLIIKFRQFLNDKAATHAITWQVFNVPPTIPADSVAYPLLWANFSKRIGEIVMPALATKDSSTSDSSSCLVSVGAGNLPLAFRCAPGDRDLYLIPLVAAHTPASGSSLYIEATAEVD